ncbi:hypothetical protein ABG768_005938, partial [Culter alburnus]
YNADVSNYLRATFTIVDSIQLSQLYPGLAAAHVKTVNENPTEKEKRGLSSPRHDTQQV